MTSPQDHEPASSQAPTVEPEALLLTVVHSVADAVIAADEHGTVTMWTGGAEAIFGWSADEILGRAITTLIPEHHREAHGAGLHRVATGGEHRVIGKGAVELSALRRDGTEFPVELTLTTGLHGGKRFFAAIVRDVSTRKLADRRLREAMTDLERSNAELQQFASIASHDLHEPLRIVAGYLDLLRRRYAEQLDEQAHVFIEHAESAVARMQLLIDDLLRYARAGSEAARAERVDLALVVGEVLETLAPTVADTHADVTVHELPAVTGDASLLRQVLQNLVVNALKFTRDDERPRIDISAKRLPAAWEISVVDSGIGVDPEASERIFEMFGRGRGTGRARAGNGIGLAICKRAIEAHGGAIRVDPGDDGGSAFRFVLPDQDVAA